MVAKLALNNSLAARERMVALIESGEPFQNHAGSFRGEPFQGSYSEGVLPGSFASVLRQDARDGLVDYIIYSYRTPIAWHTPSGWIIPDERYSPTTSKHQGQLWRLR